jgi:FkbM family methyltransferase
VRRHRSIAAVIANPARQALARLVEACGRVAQLHPFSWKLAWEAVHRLPFLLPHDKSYGALRHFIAVAPAGLFLDIGANDGISALSLRKFSKSYRILSFEPNKLLEPALKRIKSVDSQFDYRMAGAGATAARLQFFMPVYRGVLLHTFTSGSRDQVQHAIEEQFGSRVARRTAIEAVDGELVRLDDLGLDPAIVKIDAEGFDYDVLLGLTQTVARSRPFIMIEVAWTEQDRIAAFLQRYDYVLAIYDIAAGGFRTGADKLHSREPGQRNIFAVPQEKLNALPVFH